MNTFVKWLNVNIHLDNLFFWGGWESCFRSIISNCTDVEYQTLILNQNKTKDKIKKGCKPKWSTIPADMDRKAIKRRERQTD